MTPMDILVAWAIGYTCGVVTVMVMLWWARQQGPPPTDHGKVSQQHLDRIRTDDEKN